MEAEGEEEGEEEDEEEEEEEEEEQGPINQKCHKEAVLKQSH